jgi:hypothetical protein
MRFNIDFLDQQEFEGYSRGEELNGFACPYFTYEQALKIIYAWNESGGKASYEINNDQFDFVMQDGETESFPTLEVEGIKVYPIGNVLDIGGGKRRNA